MYRMIIFFILLMKCRHAKKEERRQIEKSIKEIAIVTKKHKCRLYISPFSNLLDGNLNASAAYPQMIYVNAAWVVQLYDYPSAETYDAFFQTIYHELGHKIKRYRPKGLYAPEDKWFINWINELFADFKGASLRNVENKRKCMVESHRYQLRFLKIDENGKSHPSRKERLRYATSYNFDKKLIQEVAESLNCHNSSLVNEIGDFFEEVIIEDIPL